jgi:hypothetical protein
MFRNSMRTAVTRHSRCGLMIPALMLLHGSFTKTKKSNVTK